MTARTLSDTLAPQLEMLRRAAKFADQHGFCIVLFGPNESHRRSYSTIADKRIFSFLMGGLSRFVEEWGKVNGTKLTIIKIGEPHERASLPFWFSLPRIKRFMPLIVAFDMVSTEKKGRHGVEHGHGFLGSTQFTDRIDYHGTTRDGLEAVVGLFAIPHHREILRHGYDRREGEQNQE